MIDDDHLAGFGRALAEAQDLSRTGDPAQARAEVRARLLTQNTAAPSWRRVVAPTLLALAAAAVFAVLWPWRTLTFEVGAERSPGVVGAWLATAEGHPRALAFSDGSAIELHPNSRARVAQLHDRGAQVVLEAGAALVSIEPGAGKRWQVDAGPYRVAVTGTRFDVGWDPVTGIFALDLYEGTVTVHGPTIEAGQAVVAGESLRIGEDDPRAFLAAVGKPSGALGGSAPAQAPARPSVPEAFRTSDTADASPLPPVKSRGRSSARSPAPTTDSPEHDWRALAERASYREALAAAEAQGFDDLCESLPSGDLLRLADVARFARRPERAKAALDSTRRRFAGSDTSAMAAFERGRMAFARGDAYGEAAKWFAVYLDERPDGSIAREATGRLMESQHEAGRDREAATTAGRYLARWPEGPDRDLAKQLRAGE